MGAFISSETGPLLEAEDMYDMKDLGPMVVKERIDITKIRS